jgi:hypothetical protein
LHLVLTDPKKDRDVQKMVKAGRVMTIHQEAVGTKTDRGEFGFHPGPLRQFLIFPKTLKPFEGRSVVGIKYDLLDPASETKKPRPKAHHSTGKSTPQKVPKPSPPREESSAKIVRFSAPPAPPEDAALAQLRKQVRRAIRLLEDGKTVAAFNLLKKAVGD